MESFNKTILPSPGNHSKRIGSADCHGQAELQAEHFWVIDQLPASA